MSITPDQIKTIRTEFSRLKPARVSLDGSRPDGQGSHLCLGSDTGADVQARFRACQADGKAARQQKTLFPVIIFYAPKENYQYLSA